jgi:flavin reductase (DIM6/NTAB) family NADH-FMN oxidoreductase RutF
VLAVDAEELSAADCYTLLAGAVVPRPIAWISTLSATGVANLAPFSFFSPLSSKPPRLGVTFDPLAERGTPKDTFANIVETGEYVVNIASYPLRDAVQLSSGEHDSDVDEFELTGVTAVPSDRVRPPRVKEVSVSMECEFEREIVLEERDIFVIGQVVRFHLGGPAFDAGTGRIDTGALNPLARIAGGYGQVKTAGD